MSQTEITVVVGVDGSISITADGYNAEDEVARIVGYLKRQGIDLSLEGGIQHTRQASAQNRLSQEQQA